ncbi:hypothetical protein PGT21_005912 [Puccinia graminis f. sp. tritici]|uniref:Uncharacterized protein n=1 Tax=Puccinia graminis f. sp. tritici TaxID=56615 RepID=A0A5B0NDJ5_PUCGR|nr:hypothetical protein PGT21_005912 [Puccinia graminis f. sp. tritici]
MILSILTDALTPSIKLWYYLSAAASKFTQTPKQSNFLPRFEHTSLIFNFMLNYENIYHRTASTSNTYIHKIFLFPQPNPDPAFSALGDFPFGSFALNLRTAGASP